MCKLIVLRIVTKNFNCLLAVIIIIVIFLLMSRSRQYLLLVFHCSLSDIKSSQVSRTLLSTLADLNSAEVWMDFYDFQFLYFPIWIFKTVPSAASTIGITVTLMFNSFFSSLKVPNICPCYYYISLLRVFPASVRWWFFTRVWVTANFLKFPEFFSVFWRISTMLLFGWSPFAPFISKSPSPCTRSLVAVLDTLITIVITFTFMVHSCFFLVIQQRLIINFSYQFLSVLPSGQPEQQYYLFY